MNEWISSGGAKQQRPRLNMKPAHQTLHFLELPLVIGSKCELTPTALYTKMAKCSLERVCLLVRGGGGLL